MTSRRALILLLVSVLALAACEREMRRFEEPASKAALPQSGSTAELYAGGAAKAAMPANPYEENAHAVSQGKRLFGWYNCVGCHAHGGGGSGPALMDDKWIYGHEPVNIYQTIVEGRPNGMPSFRGKIPDAQVWQLVAYVRSMGGLVRSDVAPNRDDDMQAAGPEATRNPVEPKASGAPPPK
jgi:cytochrome c oxidase cbb3-type subunit III